MNPRLFIAKRYLFAKKSHNVINIISGISAAGIAVGCAALVIILSIYNGFDDLLKSLCETYTPDLLVKPAEGKVFIPDEDILKQLRSREDVSAVCPIVEETLFLKYGDRQAIATARGVDSTYEAVTNLKDFLTEGSFEMNFGSIDQVVLGSTIAHDLAASSRFLTQLEAYFPSRTAKVSLTDPLSSLRSHTLFPSGIVSIDKEFDAKYVFMPAKALRELLEYDRKETSLIEIWVKPEALSRSGAVSDKLQREIENLFGQGFTVRNKFQQNASVYKMMTYEKLAVYLILLFVVLIISCNVFGSLSMLIIEKKEDIAILQSMGADRRLINGIFAAEGWMISLLGTGIGIIVGLGVCLAQQKFGIVAMPGNFIVSAYPVRIHLTDVVAVFFSVAAIGYIMTHCVKALRK